MSWDKELKDYRYYLSLEKKLSENTVQAYLHDLARISNYMEHTFGITEPEKVRVFRTEPPGAVDKFFGGGCPPFPFSAG